MNPTPAAQARPKQRSKAVVAGGLVLLLLGMGYFSYVSSQPIDDSVSGSRSGRSAVTGTTPSTAKGASGISYQVRFNASPAAVRRAINSYVQTWYPQAVSYLTWDATGTTLSVSGMGSSCLVVLSGAGPTVAQVNGDIGFPASIFVSELDAKQGLGHAIREIRKKIS